MKPATVRVGIHQAQPGSGITSEELAFYRERRIEVEPAGAAHHNACPVFQGGVELARYRKIHLMPGEARHGLRPGEEFVIVEARGLRVAPVICADILYPDTFDRVAAPTGVLFRTPFDEENERRTWVVEVPLESGT